MIRSISTVLPSIERRRVMSYNGVPGDTRKRTVPAPAQPHVQTKRQAPPIIDRTPFERAERLTIRIRESYPCLLPDLGGAPD